MRRVSELVIAVGCVAFLVGCDLDYRPQSGVAPVGGVDAPGVPDVAQRELLPGPCAETAFDLPEDVRSTFYTYLYNERGLLSELRYGSTLDPTVASWRYEYDARGVLRASLFEPNGRAEFEYNARGYYDAQLWNANEDGLLDSLVLITYSDTGRLTAEEVYDRNGALARRVEFESDESASTITEVLARDAQGNPTLRNVRTYSDLSLNPVPWIQDARPGVRACNRQFCYGPSMGRVLREDYYETEEGELTRSAVMRYDEAGNLIAIERVWPDGSIYSRTEYEYSCWR